MALKKEGEKEREAGRRSAGDRYRTRLILIFFFAGLVILTARLFYLQSWVKESLTRKVERQRQKSILLEGERGRILDRNGKILAANLEVPSVYAIPSRIENPSAVAGELSLILGMPKSIIEEKLTEERPFVWLKRKVLPSTAAAVENLGFEGVGTQTEPDRFYPKKHLMGHILGFTGAENQGLEGVERRYEESLQGKKMRVVLEQDARGVVVFTKSLNYRLPRRGQDIALTIDETIQYISEKELDAMMAETRAESGTVIVMRPRTGEVLAWVVRPDFNPNSVNSYAPSDWRNRAITDSYEPGSTFKIITASAALEEHVVSPDEQIYCENGSYQIDGKAIHDHTKEGTLTFSQVIAKSSNIGTAKVALRLGDEKLRKYIQAFGFGAKTGIDLGGEASGVIRASGPWPHRTLATVAIGQGISVTPLQMASAFATVANGGLYVKPILVKTPAESGTKDGESREESVRRVISEKTARELTRILGAVVQTGGTGEKAAVEGYLVAGKTGTAQLVDPETKTYSPDRFIGSFGGFVPANDPQLVILVVINQPKGVSWGGSIAAPVFRNIARQTLSYLGVAPYDTRRMLVVRNE